MFLCTNVFASSVSSQVKIDGPTCVTTEVSYQYNITGPWLASSNFQVCVTGGAIADSGTSCIHGDPVSYVRVNWTSGSTAGNLSLTSAVGNFSLDVSIIKTLDGGKIDSNTKLIIADSSTVPPSIHCSAASGGNCSPVYTYQWQQSYDMIDWDDISGGTGQNLSFSHSVSNTTYYRRKVKETKSGAFVFSDEATITNQ